MRWFGPSDPVTLEHIRQAGASGVVTALHHVQCGDLWTEAEIAKRIEDVRKAGLEWTVAESLPVHEHIKLGRGDRDRYLENYRQSLRHLGRLGVRVVCYNFMAVTDWTRTDLSMLLPTGALALRFDKTDAAVFDLFLLQRKGSEADYTTTEIDAAKRRLRQMSLEDRERLIRTILLGLPGTVKDLTLEEFRQRLADYDEIDAQRLRRHHSEFLRAVIPVAEEEGISLAIHPDDPPFPVFGLPRIAATEVDLTRILEAYDSPANGLTFCSGSLGARADNDLPGILRRLGGRVHFLHLRNVRREENGSFYEADHLDGSADMAQLMREAISLSDVRTSPLPMRPDHGHLLGDDRHSTGFYPGYSYVGRLRGLAELRGLEAGLRSGEALSP